MIISLYTLLLNGQKKFESCDPGPNLLQNFGLGLAQKLKFRYFLHRYFYWKINNFAPLRTRLWYLDFYYNFVTKLSGKTPWNGNIILGTFSSDMKPQESSEISSVELSFCESFRFLINFQLYYNYSSNNIIIVRANSLGKFLGFTGYMNIMTKLSGRLGSNLKTFQKQTNDTSKWTFRPQLFKNVNYGVIQGHWRSKMPKKAFLNTSVLKNISLWT